jgi:hypothetical protein
MIVFSRASLLRVNDGQWREGASAIAISYLSNGANVNRQLGARDLAESAQPDGLQGARFRAMFTAADLYFVAQGPVSILAGAAAHPETNPR